MAWILIPAYCGAVSGRATATYSYITAPPGSGLTLLTTFSYISSPEKYLVWEIGTNLQLANATSGPVLKSERPNKYIMPALMC